MTQPGPFDKLADSVSALAAETAISTAEVKALNLRREKLSKAAVFLTGAILVCVVLLIGLTVFNLMDRQGATERATRERARTAELVQKGSDTTARLVIIANRCQVEANDDTKKYDDCLVKNKALVPAKSVVK